MTSADVSLVASDNRFAARAAVVTWARRGTCPATCSAARTAGSGASRLTACPTNTGAWR